MDLKQFEAELREAIKPLSYVTEVEIKCRTEISIQGLIGLWKNYRLSVFFNESFYIISFSLIFRNKRIWAIDRDNRVGWHIHPIENSNAHEPIDEMTIKQIVEAFDEVCQKILKD